uniref:NADH-ubiquinone oxidoreductase chain 1 n=1 Tax=Questa ersei TaxID=645998 RepID=C4NTT6_9ANNE|nr:NADH dehydrogenase subunit 1 [Questa ersei]
MTLCPLISSVIIFIFALLAMAFYTLLERKCLGYSQTRKGPNKISILGIPQPLADALKLFTKEQSIPSSANITIFFLSPMLALFLALALWTMYPHAFPSAFIPFSILMFLCISSFNVYTILLAGWASNSKYSLLGAVRSIAQTISYEISMALILLSLICLPQSLSLNHVSLTTASNSILPILPIALLWFITVLAETNRTPFDLSEGESELVSGFNIEYGASAFALIFMAEYTNILVMSIFTAVLLTPWPPILIPLFTLTFSLLFIWIRASYPRMRYDGLMHLTWKTFLPLAITTLMILIPLLTLLSF